MELVFDGVEETLEVETELLLESVEEVEFKVIVEEEDGLWVEVVEDVEFKVKVEEELLLDAETVVVVELPEKEKYAPRVNEPLGVTAMVLFSIPLLQ